MMWFLQLLMVSCWAFASARQDSNPSCIGHLLMRHRQATRSRSCILLLRGGESDDSFDDEEDLDEDEDIDTSAGMPETLEDNPFLPSASGAAGGPGGLQDLASTLQDPKMLQEALKELQDPAVQQQVKAMMDDPAFQESMKAYMEQITKDPKFEALKKQTEEMLQQENFMEQMQQAFADSLSSRIEPVVFTYARRPIASLCALALNGSARAARVFASQWLVQVVWQLPSEAPQKERLRTSRGREHLTSKRRCASLLT